MGFLNSDPFGSDAYIDELPILKRKPSPKMVELMRRARSLDPVARRFVDCVAYCLNMMDLEPIDFAVMIDDAQDLDWNAYEAFLEGVSPGAAITEAARRHGRMQLRITVCAHEPGLRIDINKLIKPTDGRVHFFLDRPG